MNKEISIYLKVHFTLPSCEIIFMCLSDLTIMIPQPYFVSQGEISLFSKSDDEWGRGVKNLKKLMTSFMNHEKPR